MFELPEDNHSPQFNIKVPVSAYWRGFSVSLGELRSLSPGDVFMLDQRKIEEVEVFLGNIPKYRARMDRSGKTIALTLTSKILD